MREGVERVVEKLRPSLQADGSDVEIVDIEDGKITLRLIAKLNACEDCFLSAEMLKPMFESSIKSETRRAVSVIIDDQRKSPSL